MDAYSFIGVGVILGVAIWTFCYFVDIRGISFGKRALYTALVITIFLWPIVVPLFLFVFALDWFESL